MAIDFNALLVQLLVALLSIAAGALAGFVNEFRARLKAEGLDRKFDIIIRFAGEFVHAAEQLMYNGTISAAQRKQWVIDRLQEVAVKIGLKVDVATLEGLLEAVIAKSGLSQIYDPTDDSGEEEVVG